MICDDCAIPCALTAVATFRALHGIDRHADERITTLGLRLHWRKRREVVVRNEFWLPGRRKPAIQIRRISSRLGARAGPPYWFGFI